MNRICDLYLPAGTKSPEIKFLRIFDAGFFYDAERSYSGFIGVNVVRIKLVSVVSDLRKKGVMSFSVPAEYRDSPVVDADEAAVIAERYARSIGRLITGARPQEKHAPLFWMFNIVSGVNSEEKVGGVVMVDRLDGHVWMTAEYEEYMYDYNNVF
jgi:hypothetical protein